MIPAKKPSAPKEKPQSSSAKGGLRPAGKAAPKGGKKHVAKKAVAPKKEAVPAVAKETKKDAAHPGISGLRIRLSAFDHRVLDEAAAKIIDTAERSGAVVHGPIPLPTKLHKFTVNKSTFVHKNARDQYEMRIHRRLIDLTETQFKTVESLQSLSLPSGVDIEIKMK